MVDEVLTGSGHNGYVVPPPSTSRGSSVGGTTPPSLDRGDIVERLKRFPDDVQDVQSRYILVHQLRASADIQDRQTKQETGWATTSDRAQLMREAADALEALSVYCIDGREKQAGDPSGTGERDDR